MTFEYQPSGVCSKLITLEMDGEKIQRAAFYGGCNGNLKGICSLIQGQNAQDVVHKLKGIHCGDKPTSCPDQLSKALEQYLSRK